MTIKALFFGFIGLAFLILVFSTIGLLSQGQDYSSITVKRSGLLGLLGFRTKAPDAQDLRNYQNLPLPPDELEKLRKDLEKQATLSALRGSTRSAVQATPSASPF